MPDGKMVAASLEKAQLAALSDRGYCMARRPDCKV